MAFDSKTWDPLCGFHLGSATTIPKPFIDVTIKEGELIKVPAKMYFDRALTVRGDEERETI